MNKELNLVEILKDCPKGTELYSPLFGEVTLYNVSLSGEYPISVRTQINESVMFSKCGIYYATYTDSECLLFPSKDQRDWSKFVPPCKFKDGDIVATKTGLQVFILKRENGDGTGYCYMGYNSEYNNLFPAGTWYFSRLATEEEKKKLFDAIKVKGYKWNAETKTLEKLVKHKFDPKTLKPFDKVLVRDSGAYSWICAFYSHTKECSSLFRYVTNNSAYEFCIPYNDDTKHLVGTNEEAPEYYRYWED